MNFIFADRMRGMRRLTLPDVRGLPFLLSALLSLAGCAPRASAPDSKVETSTPISTVSFYPRETGLSWAYLLEGEPASAAPYVLRTLGPTIYAGQPVLAFQLTGRGADQTWYRTVSSEGVRLLGLHKPGVNVYLEPAWQEYPPEGAWKLGATWQGVSQVTISGDDGKVQARGTLNYSYTVQEQRRVQTPAGSFQVWVVTRQMSDTVGGLFPATQQLWFTPYTGEVRSPEGLLLTGRNFNTK